MNKRGKSRSLDGLRRYQKRRAGEGSFIDQSRHRAHREGPITEKYWFSKRGAIYPVEHEHGSQALTIARDLKLIPPDKAIFDFGFRSTWELAKGLFFDKGWLRVQTYSHKTIGLNAKPAALERKSTEAAVLQVLSKPSGFFFQENWPYTLNYAATRRDYKKYGWKGMIRRARRAALAAYRKEVGLSSP